MSDPIKILTPDQVNAINTILGKGLEQEAALEVLSKDLGYFIGMLERDEKAFETLVDMVVDSHDIADYLVEMSELALFRLAAARTALDDRKLILPGTDTSGFEDSHLYSLVYSQIIKNFYMRKRQKTPGVVLFAELINGLNAHRETDRD